MKTFPATYTLEKNRQIGAAPVWILKMPFASSGTHYLSDRVVTLPTWNSGVITKPWVADWGEIDENISFGNASPAVGAFRADMIASHVDVANLSTLLWTAANNIETIDCELYLWFEGLDDATNAPQLMWTGNVVDFRQTSDLLFEVEFSDQSVKLNKVLGNLLSTATYTSLPAANVGKVAPIVWGSVSGHKPICIASGGYSELAEDLDASETGIDLIDAASFGTSGYTINVNGEIMTVTGKSGNTLTVSTRSSGTTHSVGDPVVQITTITYLVADHPIKALNHVYVDGVEITTGYTFYSGQSGDEHPTYTGKAILVITNAMPAAFDEVQTVLENTASGSGWSEPEKAVDDNESTYTSCGTESTNLTVTFAASTPIFGVVKRQRVDLKWTGNPDGSVINIYYTIGGVTILGYSGPLHAHNGWSDYVTGGAADGSLVIYGTGIRDAGGDHDGWLYVYEVRQKEITFTPYASGDTCEDVIVGGEVTVDVDGYQDDGSGTYTGSAAALIEQPDHIFKHLLYTYLSVATANFVTDAATPFAADSYAFGIVIAEAKTAREWLAKMAWECRCYFRFAIGKAYLLYQPDSISSDKTITTAMIAADGNGKTDLYPERSPLSEVVNKIRARYMRNWALSGDEAYEGLYETSDATSITRYGEKEQPELFYFDFITLAAMAQDVAAFRLARLKDRKKLVPLGLYLNNAEIEFADAITITPLASLVCEVEKVNLHPGNANAHRGDKITIQAKEY